MSKITTHLLGIVAILLTAFQSFGQTPTWIWAQTALGSNGCTPTQIVTDISGNVYVLGTLSNGNMIVDNTTLTWLGGFDYYLIKYNSSGDVLWARSAGGKGVDEAFGIAPDNFGNIYVAGYFKSDTMNIGNITLINNDPSFPDKDIFLAKYDQGGNEVWAKAIPGSYDDWACGVVADQSGNVYIAGSYYSYDLTFDSFVLTHEDYDVFLAKYNSQGQAIWAERIGGDKPDWVSQIAIDKFNNIYISGPYASSNMNFGNGVFKACFAGDCFYLARYDTSGAAKWAEGLGGDVSIDALKTDKDSNIYLAGSFFGEYISYGGSIIFNSDSTGNLPDSYLFKIKCTNALDWFIHPQHKLIDYCNDVAIDNENNIYLTGYFNGLNMSIGSFILSNSDTIFPDSHSETYIVKYDSFGTAKWVTKPYDTWSDYGIGICTFGPDKSYVCGRTQGPSMEFGNITINGLYNGLIYVASLQEIATDAPGVTNVNDQALRIFPNPTSEFVNYTVNSNVKCSTILILNCYGQKVIERTLSEVSSGNFDVSTLVPGVYMIEAIAGNEIFSKKFIKL